MTKRSPEPLGPITRSRLNIRRDNSDMEPFYIEVWHLSRKTRFIVSMPWIVVGYLLHMVIS